MKIGWGWKIAALYGGFAIMIVFLVVSSSRQKIDLVSKDYYKEEIAYQQVLDASKNQANLTGTLLIHANSNDVYINFPQEFNADPIKGSVQFYSAANKEWDKNIAIDVTNGELSIPRADLQKTIYTVKVKYEVQGKHFYYETQLNLHTS